MSKVGEVRFESANSTLASRGFVIVCGPRAGRMLLLMEDTATRLMEVLSGIEGRCVCGKCQKEDFQHIHTCDELWSMQAEEGGRACCFV